MLDERHFPYEFECDGCGTTETVEHADVQDVPTYLKTSTPKQAVEYVMERRRGWLVDSGQGTRCRDCIDATY